MEIKSNSTSFTRQQAISLHQSVPPDWYEKSIKNNFLQAIWHKSRAKKIKVFSKGINGEILDIGCADGYFTNIIHKSTLNSKIIGIDILKTSISYAKSRYKNNSKLKFKVADAHNLTFPDNTFDAVYAIESLEHVVDPKTFLKEISRVLKSNGKTIILIPTETMLFKLIWYFWVRTRGKIWRGTHHHAFEPKDLPYLITKSGFKIEQIEFINFGMLVILKATKNYVKESI